MQSNTASFEHDEFIRRSALLKMVGLSKSHQIRLENQGKFPARIKLGGRSVGWSLAEVQQWMARRKIERD